MLRFMSGRLRTRKHRVVSHASSLNPTCKPALFLFRYRRTSPSTLASAGRLACRWKIVGQSFDAIGYPILPAIERVESMQARKEIYHIRDSSLYCPRDFDLSPYFAIVKPTIEAGFDYKTINWSAKDPS